MYTNDKNPCIAFTSAIYSFAGPSSNAKFRAQDERRVICFSFLPDMRDARPSTPSDQQSFHANCFLFLVSHLLVRREHSIPCGIYRIVCCVYVNAILIALDACSVDFSPRA